MTRVEIERPKGADGVEDTARRLRRELHRFRVSHPQDDEDHVHDAFVRLLQKARATGEPWTHVLADRETITKVVDAQRSAIRRASAKRRREKLVPGKCSTARSELLDEREAIVRCLARAAGLSPGEREFLPIWWEVLRTHHQKDVIKVVAATMGQPTASVSRTKYKVVRKLQLIERHVVELLRS